MGGVSKSTCKLLCDSEKFGKAAVRPAKNNSELLKFNPLRHSLFLDQHCFG